VLKSSVAGPAILDLDLMKSGDYSITRTDKASTQAFAEIRDRHFEQRTFSSRPALVAKETANGCRESKDYHDGPYDRAKYELAPGVWDHDHCSVCFFSIKDGHTYWENHSRIILLCDACYEIFTKS